MSKGADLILYNGRIATLENDCVVVPAIAITDGIIEAVGSDAECLLLRQAKTICIDLAGAFVMPGINDSHCHPDAQAAKSGRWKDLSTLASIDELLVQIHEFHDHAAPSAWFLGFRFDDNNTNGYPNRQQLDLAAPGRPIFILRRDAQVGVASQAALDQLDRSILSASIPKQCIDASSGQLQGPAVFALSSLIAQSDTIEDVLNGLPLLFDEMARYGITSVHNALTSALAVDAYQHLRLHNRLPVRVGMVLNGRDQALIDRTIDSGLRFGDGDARLYTLGVEYGADGSTSGRTAAYYRPYATVGANALQAPNFGRVNFSATDIAQKMTRVMAAGLQVTATGNGDRGIDFALDAMEYALTQNPGAVAPRIEHCCCAPPAIQQRMAALGVIDSSASGFLYNLGDMYLQNRPAEDIEWMWPHRDMIDRGVLVCGHSDAPVCDRNPFFGMWSMVTRKTRSGAVIAPEQAISVLESMRCYTVHPAIAEGQAHRKGTLAKAKLADMIVLDRDILSVPLDDLRTTKVLTTLVGGRSTYCAPHAPWASQLPTMRQ